MSYFYQLKQSYILKNHFSQNYKDFIIFLQGATSHKIYKLFNLNIKFKYKIFIFLDHYKTPYNNDKYSNKPTNK